MVKNFLETDQGFWVMEGMELDGLDDEGSSFGPREFALERVDGCIADVVGIESDRKSDGKLGGSVVGVGILHRRLSVWEKEINF